jgi:hypothetical protein
VLSAALADEAYLLVLSNRLRETYVLIKQSSEREVAGHGLVRLSPGNS